MKRRAFFVALFKGTATVAALPVILPAIQTLEGVTGAAAVVPVSAMLVSATSPATGVAPSVGMVVILSTLTSYLVTSTATSQLTTVAWSTRSQWWTSPDDDIRPSLAP